jgi:hypothetical protein
MCRTLDGREHDPPPEITEVYEWARRYNNRYTHCDLSLEAEHYPSIGLVSFHVLGFRIMGEHNSKSTSIRQVAGEGLTVRCHRNITERICKGPCTIEQAKAVMRWALVSDHTLRDCPAPPEKP